MPTSPAMASSVVPSKPRSANSRNAARSISAWLVAGGRPSREAPCGVAIAAKTSNRSSFCPSVPLLFGQARDTPQDPPCRTYEEATMPRPHWLSNPWEQNPWFER